MYSTEHVFNMDENSLFWRKMPERTFVLKEARSIQGFKVLKDRVTLLLGGSVAGYRLKPFGIRHREDPRAFSRYQ